MISNIPTSIHKELGYYIYLYIDPDTHEIFYVGKGKGNRAFAHLSEISEKEKVKRINEIRQKGKEPIIEILIHGISDEETALKIEASVIDLLGIKRLTNIQKGYHSRTHGRMSIEQIMATYSPKKIFITDPVIVFKINKTFHYGMSERELYDYTRHSWTVGIRRNSARYAFTLYHGIVQEVYEIERWYPQNTTPNLKHERGESKVINTERWEFVGHIAEPKIREKYLLKDISQYLRSNQSPFEYINC